MKVWSGIEFTIQQDWLIDWQTDTVHVLDRDEVFFTCMMAVWIMVWRILSAKCKLQTLDGQVDT